MSRKLFLSVLLIFVICMGSAILVTYPISASESEWMAFLPIGKSYLAMPVIPDNASHTAVFGPDVEIWAYDASLGAVPPSYFGGLECGKGYGIRSPESRVYDIEGIDCATKTWNEIKTNLVDEWNLVGPGSTDVVIEDNLMPIWWWDPVEDEWVILYKGDTLKKGEGYWIYK